ncbi:MAG: hypothetical protein GC131_05570 [Alphaproteobacteria bacterium]|nr:hypothetical protein [Alphaproteobacteria bacterium]
MHAPTAWFFTLPPWAAFTLLGVMMTYAIGLAGFILARMGIKPLWALLILVPFANVTMLWVLAHKKWPAEQIS